MSQGFFSILFDLSQMYNLYANYLCYLYKTLYVYLSEPYSGAFYALRSEWEPRNYELGERKVDWSCAENKAIMNQDSALIMPDVPIPTR